MARGAAGCSTAGRGDPVRPDTVFRIASVTKPVVAAAALSMVDEGALGLDDPVDDVLPELADRRVLADPEAGTVPARRPITVRDVLTFRLGLGMDFTVPWPPPTVTAMLAAGVHVGPPAPQADPGPDEWLRRLATAPLACQPGERWLYRTGASVLGVLVARVAGRPLPEVLTERVFAPLGMASTGFSVPESARDRLGPHRVVRLGRRPGRLLVDPVSGVTAILLTNQMWSSAQPPALFRDFWAATFGGART